MCLPTTPAASASRSCRSAATCCRRRDRAVAERELAAEKVKKRLGGGRESDGAALVVRHVDAEEDQVGISGRMPDNIGPFFCLQGVRIPVRSLKGRDIRNILP